MQDEIVILTKSEFISILRKELREALIKPEELSHKEYLTRNEACQMIGISLVTLDSLFQKGVLKKYFIENGRNKIFVKLSEVQEYIKPKQL